MLKPLVIRISFGTRLATAVGALTLLTVGALAIVAWLTSSRVLTQEIQMRLDTICQVREEQTSLYISNTFTALQLITSRLIMQNALLAVHAGRRLTSTELSTGTLDLKSSVESYRGVYIAQLLDYQDRVLFSNTKNVVSNFFAQHPSVAAWPAGCCDGLLSGSYDVNASDSLTSQAFVFTSPVTLNKTRLGSLRLLISTDELYMILAGRAGLQDSRGQVLLVEPMEGETFSLVLPAAHDSIAGSRALGAYPCLQAFVLSDNASSTTVSRDCGSYNGITVRSASKRVTAMNAWILIAEIPESVLSRPILSLRNYLLIGIFSNLFISLVVSALWATRAVRPLKRLQAAANEFTLRNFSARAKPGRPWLRDELSDLTKAFNDMAGYLQDLYGNMEDKVNQRTQALHVANGAKSAFLASISHEIRTPLNGIIGMASLLADTKPQLTSEQQDMTQSIRECAESLLIIVNDVLDFSKVEAGKMTVESRPIDIRHIVQTCIYLLTPRAQARSLGLSYTVSDDTPRWIRGDHVRLQQILNNLLTNAIKFTEHGSVSVTVSTHTDVTGTHMARFAVEDTGIGISEEGITRLFKSFSQVDLTISRKFGGTGLGLAISKALAQLLGGDIHVESVERKGSTFTLDIPVVACDEPPQSIIDSHDENNTLGADVANAAILLAEDNAVNVRIAVGLLKKMGCSCDVVVNGALAVEAVGSKAYDIILMDLQMPEMDGLEATKIIRASPAVTRQPAIIALTANAMPADRQRCLDSGMDDYLSKPIKFAALRTSIDNALRRSRPPDSPIS